MKQYKYNFILYLFLFICFKENRKKETKKKKETIISKTSRYNNY